ncbi:MAG: type IVB secretion system coupling complex protein DotM/IcmP [Gammaproteobacteria bacterium]
MAAQQQQQDDGSYTPLWIAVGIFIIGFVLWKTAHDPIVAFVVNVKIYQIAVLRFFNSELISLQYDLMALSPQTYGSVSADRLNAILEMVGKTLRYPVAGILIILGIWIYLSSPILRYKRLHSMQTLTEQEAADWPQITPVAHLDLVKEHAEKGAWAMGITPMQFAKKHHLLQEERGTVDATGAPKITASLLRAPAYQILAAQLGSYWMGAERLPPHIMALFAIFAARIGGNRDSSSKLLSQIAASAKLNAKNNNKPNLNLAGTTALLNQYKNHKLVLKITQRHAFVVTVMASMLMAARNDGVLASADFLWLKVVDRPLWFMLNCVGRRTAFVEAAGVYAHWNAELLLGQAIRIPLIDEAVNGLEMAVKEVVYIPEERDDI